MEELFSFVNILTIQYSCNQKHVSFPFFRDGQVIVWNIPRKDADDTDSTSFLPKRVFSIPVSEKSVNAACFLTDNKFAVGSDEGSVTIWMISKPSAAGKAWRVK